MYQTVGAAGHLWVEKYRPKEMSDLVPHEQIIGTITKLIDAGKLPHLSCPAGTGKTSTISRARTRCTASTSPRWCSSSTRPTTA